MARLARRRTPATATPPDVAATPVNWPRLFHEHSCIRCPMLRIDPAQRDRLEEIRDNLLARIAEAEREGWAGETEGLKVSLAAANNKIAQVDMSAARRAEAVSLGIPAYRDIAAAALRACAADLYPLEAGTELLISNGTFLHRDDFTPRFITCGTSEGAPMAAIDWDAAITALANGGLPCSGGERRILQLSASLAAGTPVSLRDTVTASTTRAPPG